MQLQQHVHQYREHHGKRRDHHHDHNYHDRKRRDGLLHLLDGGAEGTNESGENFLFIYNNEASYGGLMIMDPGMTEQQVYILGPMVRDEEDADAYVIQDEVEDLKLRFWIENNGDDGFDVRFKDDDVAQLSYIDFDAVINDMVTLIESGVAH